MREGLGGLVLAGGRSSRMGTDKAALMLAGQSMLQRTRALLAEVGAAPVLTSGAGYDLPDAVPDAGPISGLIALCDYISGRDAAQRWLIVPVDMPLLTAAALRRLLQSDARAAHFGGHPFPLLLRCDDGVRRATAAWRPAPASRGVSMTRLASMLEAEQIASPGEDVFANTNTPDDWRRLAIAS